MYIEILFAVAVTLTILAIAFASRAVGEKKKREAVRRLAAAGDSSMELPAVITPRPINAGSRSRFDNWFDNAVRKSGLDASPAGVVAVMLLSATLLGFGMYFWTEKLGLAALGVIVGFIVPLGVVWYYYRRYRQTLQDQLPEAYRMLAGSVRAGQSLEHAIEFYGERGNKPLADEFAHCAALMRLGMAPVAALSATSERVRLLDFDLLVSTIGLYTQTGGNLVVLLERLADSVRDRNQYRGQFKAATAQSRVVALAIGCAAPLMLLVYAVAEPDHVNTFFESTSGWIVVSVCVALEIIGLFWLWWLLRVDY